MTTSFEEEKKKKLHTSTVHKHSGNMISYSIVLYAFSKSITDYNFESKTAALSNTGHNELAIHRIDSPDINKDEFSPYLDFLKNKKQDASMLDALFGASIKNVSNECYVTNDKEQKHNDLHKNKLKSSADLIRELEKAKRRLQEINGGDKSTCDDQSEITDEDVDNRPFPLLRRIAWNLMRYGLPLFIIFGILFAIIWYMMKSNSASDQGSG
ncbi:Hypothetical predicted protein [Mytilus galloprovincialis]|uniref:Uncharacterized protein n=1 Tax=Mytilus galloprovincialis TaxID=29158 RepID=A0A8B6H6X4_MYTGA|nr:Hypothetical predicted protein [Mytilus galloprovincialis]